jgi:hypothetical protein
VEHIASTIQKAARTAAILGTPPICDVSILRLHTRSRSSFFYPFFVKKAAQPENYRVPSAPINKAKVFLIS